MKLLCILSFLITITITMGTGMDIWKNFGPQNETQQSLWFYSPSRRSPPSEEACAEIFTCEGKAFGYYPNIHNCSTAFNCQSGGLFTVICPNGYEFNPSFECVQNSGCIPCPESSIPEFCFRPFSCTGKLNGWYKDPWACSTYFICKDGEIYTESEFIPNCPPGAKYDHGKKKCVSSLKNCIPYCPNERPQSPSTPQPIIVTTTLPPETCRETCTDKPDGLYPSPIACHYYYICTEGRILLKICKDGQRFNPATRTCEDPELGGICWVCVETPTIVPPTLPPITTPAPTTLPTTTFPTTPCVSVETCKETCECKPDGLYPSPIACHYYYGCTEGRIHLKICKDGQRFNPATRSCEDPELGGICWVCCPATESPIVTPTPTGHP